jgi:hypothetical protein
MKTTKAYKSIVPFLSLFSIRSKIAKEMVLQVDHIKNLYARQSSRKILELLEINKMEF